jgi:hypothetical protein
MHRFPAAGAIEHDPALLAFVKCHVSSVLRWDLLWYLAQHVSLWLDAPTLSRALNRPISEVDSALRELADEGLVETTGRDASAPRYTMQPGEPTTIVVQRLVAAAQRSQEVRRLIVARVAA